MAESSENTANRYSLSQQVRNHILNKVATGEIAPGDKIVEARIAAELNVSTIPVREAIRELAQQEEVDEERMAREVAYLAERWDINEEIVRAGGQPATARPVMLGITKAALNTESFLSGASFQHTVNVLAGAAIEVLNAWTRRWAAARGW